MNMRDDEVSDLTIALSIAAGFILAIGMIVLAKVLQ